MLRIIFIFILLSHGLIHLLGFVKEFSLATISQPDGKSFITLSSDYSKLVGLLGLVTCLLFFTATATFLLKKDSWWMFAVPAVLLSQFLIILYWPEAKFGTLANIIVLAGITLFYAYWRFTTMIGRELEFFLPRTVQEPQIITEKMLDPLPAIVQKWLTRCRVPGKEMTYSVYLKQHGQMRTNPDSKWMPVAAEEYFTVDKPGFIWIADVKAAPFVHLYGRDKYENGKGHMLIKLFSLFTVADAKGEETDQGTLLRYLGEIVWFPSAALSEYIKWEEINDTSVKATMSYGGISAKGVFTFTTEGDMISFEAQRYYQRKDGPTLEDWFISIDENGYKEFEGIRIPAKCAVTWRLKEGDFTWFSLEVDEVDYNRESTPAEKLASP
jgi:hypothetical protein